MEQGVGKQFIQQILPFSLKLTIHKYQNSFYYSYFSLNNL